ncbi:MAG: CNNM domain-containing protein [Planctomycetota bacterium]|nr:CNNM domain-containing protein [Planctomycetota bacterium]MDA1180710.1 CNNM domain-containing protein [Planctomycetota bacterium]
MTQLFDIGASITGMALLVAVSAFFSASEAALFSLKASESRRLERTGSGGRIATELLRDPNRLLTAVLFWNLVVNMAYFALVSMSGLHLERAGSSRTLTIGFSVVSLILIIFIGEMLPKSLGVLLGRHLAMWVAVPLAMMVRVMDPLLPIMRTVTVLSERLLWPGFQPEAYLEVADLERAVQKSTNDAQLQAQEHQVLHQLVSLSTVRVDEWMRPRSQLTVLRPPVSWGAWGDALPAGGYLLVAEEDSDEIALWLNLEQVSGRLPATNLEYACQPVIFVPWCATVADTFEQMISSEREVAAVVTELGETVGVLTLDDIIETLFTSRGGIGERLSHDATIVKIADNVWRLSGMTNLRRVAEEYSVDLPNSRSVTVAGWLEECLERLPRVGDRVNWGNYQLEVMETPDDQPIVIELTVVPDEVSSEGTEATP